MCVVERFYNTYIDIEFDLLSFDVWYFDVFFVFFGISTNLLPWQYIKFDSTFGIFRDWGL